MKTFETTNTELIVNEEPPAEILAAQKEIHIKEEQGYCNKIHLFFSFDIVNSTMYKNNTFFWPIVITELLESIRKRVEMTPELAGTILWRVIGDEMIFVMAISRQEQLCECVRSIFEITQRISIALKSGRFFSCIENQAINRRELEQLRINTPLSIKTAAWIASISNENNNAFDCIKTTYKASNLNQEIVEFLGSDIDTGFRLKKYTQDRRVTVSYELACLLENEQSKLFIVDYTRFKGVWNGGLYPIIWYYDQDIMRQCTKELLNKDEIIPFSRSFRYDETDNNPLVLHYFARGKQSKNEKKVYVSDDKEYTLADTMFDAKKALPKILVDRNLQAKLEYFKELLCEDKVNYSLLETTGEPLELHCAVVCVDVENRKVMIVHRGDVHNTNPQKWEFGCAKATSQEKLKDTIEKYYKEKFNVVIDLICDDTREDVQPTPLAVYELEKGKNIKKGVIFVAKVKENLGFRECESHDRQKWISEKEIDNFPEENTVKDFNNTLRLVFSEFDSIFGGKRWKG